MAPKPVPDDGQQSPRPVQPPYGATHPPGITHKEIAGIPFWGALAILIAVVAVVAIVGWIVRYPLRYPPPLCSAVDYNADWKKKTGVYPAPSSPPWPPRSQLANLCSLREKQ